MGPHSEAAGPGEALRCASCGTEVRMRRVGGGRMDCCGRPLGAAAAGGEAEGRARCAGCGNEADVLHDGGGTLACCNRPMERG